MDGGVIKVSKLPPQPAPAGNAAPAAPAEPDDGFSLSVCINQVPDGMIYVTSICFVYVCMYVCVCVCVCVCTYIYIIYLYNACMHVCIYV